MELIQTKITTSSELQAFYKYLKNIRLLRSTMLIFKYKFLFRLWRVKQKQPEAVDWIHLAQDVKSLPAVTDMIMNTRVPQKMDTFVTN
jgi:hypothetical protein